MRYKQPTFLLIIILCFFKSVYANDSTLSIENAWIAEAPPVSKVMVAYMTLKNTGSKHIEIISAESDAYSSIEFHQTIHEDGLVKMIRHSDLRIEPNTSMQLKRGGMHLMLFNPKKRLKAGDIINIRLSTKDNIGQTVSVTVKKALY